MKIISPIFHTVIFMALILWPGWVFAHPVPSSVVMLNIGEKRVSAELQLPLLDLQFAVPFDVTFKTEKLIERHAAELTAYLIQHFRPVTANGLPWKVTVSKLLVKTVGKSQGGPYQELVVFLLLDAPKGSTTKNFILNYDVIIQQLATHTALVKIQYDWESGINAEHPVEVGVIALDLQSNTIPPLHINLQEGSIWRGFKSMVLLGIDHIREGTDHLLFLLVLLLPAPLLHDKNKWSVFGGAKYSLTRLLKIVTAFTIGHSVTLILGAFGWVHLPVRPVEIIIAFSIFICALHAIRPFFAGREMFIAALFGLFHGLAFATILSDLNLDSEKMALSILGFNIGIELMQIFAVVITMPWLMLLSRTSYYPAIRITGAVFAIIASLTWIFERSFDTTTIISSLVKNIAGYSIYIISFFAIASVILYFQHKQKTEIIQK